MIYTFRRIIFIFLLSQLVAVNAFGESIDQNKAEVALAEARRLNQQALLEGTRWIIAIEHLSQAEELARNKRYPEAIKIANQAIHFFILGLEQKKQPLYEHR